jgi:oligoribonuclease NrnB/cAMP/cGMP phosphodiesterase (DHH superfamily)
MSNDQTIEVIHLTNHNLDGAACAVLSEFIFRGREVISGSCKMADQALQKLCERKQKLPEKEQILIITDLVVTPERIEECLDTFGIGNVAVFDHSPVSLSLEGYDACVRVDTKRSSAQIFSDFIEVLFRSPKTDAECFANTVLSKTSINELSYASFSEIEMKSVTDRLIIPVTAEHMNHVSSILLEEGKHLHRLFCFFGFDRFVEEAIEVFLYGIKVHSPLYNKTVRESLMREELSYLEQAIDRSLVYDVKGHPIRVAWTVASRHISRVGERLILKHGANVAVIYNLEESTMHIITSRGSGFHAGEMAAILGGGGGTPTEGFAHIPVFRLAKERYYSRPILPLPAIDAYSKEEVEHLTRRGLSSEFQIPKGSIKN